MITAYNKRLKTVTDEAVVTQALFAPDHVMSLCRSPTAISQSSCQIDVFKMCIFYRSIHQNISKTPDICSRRATISREITKFSPLLQRAGWEVSDTRREKLSGVRLIGCNRPAQSLRALPGCGGIANRIINSEKN